MKVLTINDFESDYSCRFHPIHGWHEIGCPHRKWTKEELQQALDNAKQSNAYLVYLMGQPKRLKKGTK